MFAYEARAQSRLKWYEVWWLVWTQPGPAAFRSILKDAGAGSRQGEVWIAAAAVIGTAASILIFRNTALLGVMDCTVFIVPVLALAGLEILAGFYHLVAQMLGGSGTFREMVYCLGAILAPYTLVGVASNLVLQAFFEPGAAGALALKPVHSLPAFGVVVGLMVVIASLYALGLLLVAIAAVEHLELDVAAMVLASPAAVVLFLGLCLFMFTLMAGAPG